MTGYRILPFRTSKISMPCQSKSLNAGQDKGGIILLDFFIDDNIQNVEHIAKYGTKILLGLINKFQTVVFVDPGPMPISRTLEPGEG
jgi:hypothetical protein